VIKIENGLKEVVTAAFVNSDLQEVKASVVQGEIGVGGKPHGQRD
jgi:hypothetical protein